MPTVGMIMVSKVPWYVLHITLYSVHISFAYKPPTHTLSSLAEIGTGQRISSERATPGSSKLSKTRVFEVVVVQVSLAVSNGVS